MRSRLQAGLGITTFIALTGVLTSPGAAQTSESPWTAATATATATDTSGKSHQGTIDVNSFQFGVGRSLPPTQGSVAQEGKTPAVSEITVDSGKPVTPVYKGPRIILPPSSGTPNDSAHKHPKH